MRPEQLYNTFGKYHPDIVASIRSFGALKGCNNAIKMRDEKGHLYIFQFEGPKKWSLYYGAAALTFERSLRHDHS